MVKRCLCGCGALIGSGSYAPGHKPATGWGNRDRAAQARFRRELVARAGSRCEWRDRGTGMRCLATDDLRACHVPPLAKGGTYDVTPEDKLYCKTHDRLTDPYAR